MTTASLISAMSSNSVFFSRKVAVALRAALGTSTGRKKRLTALNIALKFVRKLSTDAEGNMKLAVWDLSRLRGSQWPVPAWERPGKGQFGSFTDRLPPVQLEVREILAQLGPEDFEKVFPEVGGDDGGVRGVAIMAVGGVGVWWAGRCPDYELVLVADSGLHQVKARLAGTVRASHGDLPSGTALAGGDLQPAGEPAGLKRACWQTWRSTTDADKFLYGG